MTRPGLSSAAVGRELVRCLRIVMPFFLLFSGACATPSQQAEQPTKVVESAKTAPVTRQTDASAAYHFMLGYQAELAQNSELALKEYQAALKADPMVQSVKARLASLRSEEHTSELQSR